MRAWSRIFWKGLPSSSVFLISTPASRHPLADLEMRLVDLREPGVDDLLVELILLLEAEHLRRLLGEDVDDAVEDGVVQVGVVDGDRFDLLAEARASSIAVISAPNDCGLPSMPTRIVSRSASSGLGHVLDDPDVAVGLARDAFADRADHAVARAADAQRADHHQVVRRTGEVLEDLE